MAFVVALEAFAVDAAAVDVWAAVHIDDDWAVCCYPF